MALGQIQSIVCFCKYSINVIAWSVPLRIVSECFQLGHQS